MKLQEPLNSVFIFLMVTFLFQNSGAVQLGGFFGKVTDSQGNPVSNACILIEHGTRETHRKREPLSYGYSVHCVTHVYTDSEGWYRYHCEILPCYYLLYCYPPHGVNLSVEKKYFRVSSSTFLFQRKTQIDFVLKKGAKVFVKVIDEDGNHIPEAEVEISCREIPAFVIEDRQYGLWRATFCPSISGYEVDGLPKGRLYITCRLPKKFENLEYEKRKKIYTNYGETISVNFVFERGVTISGKVTKKGVPIEGCKIYLLKKQEPCSEYDWTPLDFRPTVITNSDGFFEINRLGSGTYTLFCITPDSKGQYKKIHIKKGETKVINLHIR